MRRFTTVLTLALVTTTALAACGSEVRDTPPVAPPTSTSMGPSAPYDVDLSGEVVAHGLLMQTSAGAPVQLCVGPIAESYPPQCGGPTVVGDVDWDAVKTERASGVTWTSGQVWAIGHFAPKTGKLGTFTLTKPVQSNPPTGLPQTSPTPVDFPQLCKDPYADGGSKSGGGPDTNAITELLPTLDGYVSSWVSDGSSLFNVLVTGDAAAARREIRKVWKGGLCVEQRDLPTEADVRAAQDALGKKSQDLGLQTIGGDSQGALGVEATYVDAATRAQILETVRPWLTPEQVRITSSIQPLPQ